MTNEEIAEAADVLVHAQADGQAGAELAWRLETAKRAQVRLQLAMTEMSTLAPRLARLTWPLRQEAAWPLIDRAQDVLHEISTHLAGVEEYLSALAAVDEGLVPWAELPEEYDVNQLLPGINGETLVLTLNLPAPKAAPIAGGRQM